MESLETPHSSKYFDEDSSGIVKFTLDKPTGSIRSRTQVDGPREDVKLIKKLHKVHGPLDKMDFNKVLDLLETEMKLSILYRDCWRNAKQKYRKSDQIR